MGLRTKFENLSKQNNFTTNVRNDFPSEAAAKLALDVFISYCVKPGLV